MGWLRKEARAKRRGNHAAHPEQRAKADVRHYGKVLADYGVVLQASAAMVFGKPATMLPFPKSEIKLAVLWELQALQKIGKLDAKLRHDLIVAYAQLAYFYEDADDAKNAMLTSAAFGGRNPGELAPDELARQMESIEFSRAIGRFSDARKESDALVNELHEAAKQAGVDL